MFDDTDMSKVFLSIRRLLAVVANADTAAADFMVQTSTEFCSFAFVSTSGTEMSDADRGNNNGSLRLDVSNDGTTRLWCSCNVETAVVKDALLGRDENTPEDEVDEKGLKAEDTVPNISNTLKTTVILKKRVDGFRILLDELLNDDDL